jgi:hypothetical protein
MCPQARFAKLWWLDTVLQSTRVLCLPAVDHGKLNARLTATLIEAHPGVVDGPAAARVGVEASYSAG